MVSKRYTDSEFILMTADLTDEVQKHKGDTSNALMLIHDFQYFFGNPKDNILIAYPTGKGLINPTSMRLSKSISFLSPMQNDVAMRLIDPENAITKMVLDLVHIFAELMKQSNDDSVVYLVIKTLIYRNYYSPYDQRVQLLHTTDLYSYTMHSFESYREFIAKASEWERKYK